MASNRIQGELGMKLNDTVRVKGKNVIGTIVDISHRNGSTYYVVESSTEGAIEGKDGGSWPLFDCKREEIEAINQERRL